MKKIIFIILLICMSSISLAAQEWELLHSPLKNNLTGIQVMNKDTLYLISNMGDFARSYNGGKIWGGNQIAPNVSLEDIEFISASTGFVCGSKGTVLKTNDSGRTWQEVIHTDSSAWFFDIQMLDDKNGLVIGLSRTSESPFSGIAFRTIDGGNTWYQINPGGIGYSELQMKNDTVYMLSFGNLNWSTDKGRSWEQISTNNSSPARALSIFDKTMVICGLKGNVFYSHDNGKDWVPSNQQEDYNFIAAQMIDDKTGYIAGGPAVLMKTADGCKTWTKEEMPDKFTIFDFYLDGDYLYAVGSTSGFMRKKVK